MLGPLPARASTKEEKTSKKISPENISDRGDVRGGGTAYGGSTPTCVANRTVACDGRWAAA